LSQWKCKCVHMNACGCVMVMCGGTATTQIQMFLYKAPY
jgi:hypothetical protein